MLDDLNGIRKYILMMDFRTIYNPENCISNRQIEINYVLRKRIDSENCFTMNDLLFYYMEIN